MLREKMLKNRRRASLVIQRYIHTRPLSTSSPLHNMRSRVGNGYCSILLLAGQGPGTSVFAATAKLLEPCGDSRPMTPAGGRGGRGLYAPLQVPTPAP